MEAFTAEGNASTSHQPSDSNSAQISTDLRNPTADSNSVKSHVMESQADSQGLQGLDKQQHPHFSQTSFPTYGSSGSNYSAFSTTNFSSSTSTRPQLHDSQMRQAAAHLNIASNHLGPTTQNTNVMNTAKFERPPSFSDHKKMPARTLTQMTSNAELPQNLAEWASSTGVSSSTPYAKQESVDQSSELQFKAQLNSSQGLSNLSSAQNMMSSLTSPIGPGNNKAPLKRPLVGQKKQTEAPGSSPPSSKKQKVAGAFLDQSVEQLNDVTAVSGVNLREEEERLFSGSKEDSRASEASRRVVQEEEGRLI